MPKVELLPKSTQTLGQQLISNEIERRLPLLVNLALNELENILRAEHAPRKFKIEAARLALTMALRRNP